MADATLDDELLALAGDDDDEAASENEDANLVPSPRESRSPEGGSAQGNDASTHTSPSSGPQSSSESALKRKASSKMTKGGSAKRVRSDSRNDNGRTTMDSPVNSLGSGAMSESEAEEPSSAMPLDEVEDDHPFPIEGKFRSLKDKAEIMALPEARREQILSERLEDIEKNSFARVLKQRVQDQQAVDARGMSKKRKDGPEADISPRKLTRQKTKATENLEAYKRQREQRNEQRRRDGDRREQDRFSPSVDRDGSDADGDGEDDDVDWDDKPARSSSPGHQERPLILDNIRAVKVGRSAFAKHCFTPGFDDAIKGVFVRLAVGLLDSNGQRDYRMGTVKEVITGKPYYMEGSNRQPFQTDQYMVVVQAKEHKTFPFTQASDGQFTEREFERWKRYMAEAGLSLPKPSSCENKYQQLTKVVNHQWTDSEISAKLRRGRVEITKNAAIHRNRLHAERQTALRNEDEAELARIDKELAYLNNTQTASGTTNGNAANGKPEPTKPLSQQDRLAAVNSRHRRQNYEEIRKAQMMEARAERKARLAVERGEAVANPFARVKTRAKVVHDFDNEGRLAVPKLKENDDLFESSEPSRTGTPQPGTQAATNGGPKPKEPRKFGTFSKKKNDDDFLQNMDFELDIEL